MASKSGLKFSEQTARVQRVSYFFIFITPPDILETEPYWLQRDQSIGISGTLAFFGLGYLPIVLAYNLHTATGKSNIDKSKKIMKR